MSERYANASDIIPQIKYLKFFVSSNFIRTNLSGLGTTLSSLAKSFEKRFEIYLTNTNCILATFLDPRYKLTPFANEELGSMRHKDEIELALIEHYLKYERDNTDTVTGNEDGANEECDDPDEPPELNEANTLESPDFQGFANKKINFEVWANAQLFSEPETANTTPEPLNLSRLTIQNEIETFNKMKKLDLKGDVFKWWNEHKILFPSLAVLARKFLSSPPSSVESERLFSIGGNIYTPHRARLNADMGEKLMFLNFNLRLLPLLELDYKY